MTKPTLEPYPGLRPYREDEQDKFFGREAEHVLIDKILNALPRYLPRVAWAKARSCKPRLSLT